MGPLLNVTTIIIRLSITIECNEKSCEVISGRVRRPRETPTFTPTSKPGVDCMKLPVQLYSADQFFPEWDNALQLRLTSVLNELRYSVLGRDDSLSFIQIKAAIAIQRRAYSMLEASAALDFGIS